MNDELKKIPVPEEEVLPTCVECLKFQKDLKENLSGGVSGIEYKCTAQPDFKPWPAKPGCIFHSELEKKFSDQALGSFEPSLSVPQLQESNITTLLQSNMDMLAPLLGPRSMSALDYLLKNHAWNLTTLLNSLIREMLDPYTQTMQDYIEGITAHHKAQLSIFSELSMATMRRGVEHTLGAGMLQARKKESLSQLEECTTIAIDYAKETPEKFSDEGINWGDLRCVNVEAVQSISEDENDVVEYRVFIEELAPECTKFRKHIEEALYAAGFTKVEVHMEW